MTPISTTCGTTLYKNDICSSSYSYNPAQLGQNGTFTVNYQYIDNNQQNQSGSINIPYASAQWSQLNSNFSMDSNIVAMSLTPTGNNLYVGTNSGAIYNYNKQNQQWSTYQPSSLLYGSVTCLAADDQNVYAGLLQGAIPGGQNIMINLSTQTILHYFLFNYASACGLNQQQSIYYGSSVGDLYDINGQIDQFDTSFGTTTSLAFDKYNNIYMAIAGTAGVTGKVFICTNNSCNQIHASANNVFPTSLTTDSFNNVYVGSANNINIRSYNNGNFNQSFSNPANLSSVVALAWDPIHYLLIVAYNPISSTPQIYAWDIVYNTWYNLQFPYSGLVSNSILQQYLAVDPTNGNIYYSTSNSSGDGEVYILQY